MIVDPEAQEELLTPGEVAALLDVDPKTVTRWARAGKLVAIRPRGVHRRYLRSEVLAIKSGFLRDRYLDRDVAQDPSRDDIMVPSPRGGHTTKPTSGGAVEVDPEREAAAAAVAEAVALALEAVAAEASAVARLTAAAVTEAAARTADAAESARGARAFAADAAAQSVAAEAARAATQVRERADTAAAQVRQAAALAAKGLAHSVEQGTALETGREANLLKATVQAAAEATAEETTRAAKAVRTADLVAAAKVKQTLAAAAEVVEREVTATAEVQQDLATATAADMADETDARAAGVARAAQEAAAAVIEGQRARSVGRKADPGGHEPATAAREARTPGRTKELEEILAAAEERDSRAELRDRAAEEREKAASPRALLEDPQQEEYEQHATGLSDPRAAELDRAAAKADRARAAMDRAKLSAQLSAGSGPWGFNGARMIDVSAELSHHLRAPLRSIISSVEMLEVALRESDDRLRFLVDAVSDYAIISLDPDGIIESWNTGAERLKGYTPEEALGRHFSIFYPAEDCDSGLPQRLLDRARAEGSCHHTGWRVRKDGSQFWADVIISAAHDDTGNLTGFVKVVRDLTEQHQLESAQASFYNAFEHDFRMPITAIKGFAELVRDADPMEREDLVERLDANANRLLGMVEELIDYARLRSGLGPISLRIVDMTALARLAVANLASIAETSRVQLTATKPVTVIADPAALERVIANLVTNALKYSPAESEINLICEQGEEVGVLKIVDAGRGIDERDLGSIFLEFERGRLAQDDSGTGLGLASVQRLIGLQDGTVAITSQVDVGTTVIIQLPLAPDPDSGTASRSQQEPEILRP